ncbi:MAG: DUF2069 domain-containing protein [Pseudomonadales bacterium]
MTISTKVQRTWQAMLALYFSLLTVLVLDHTIVRSNLFLPVLLMQTLPLLLVLPGMLKQQERSGIWLCFMILFHLLAAISNAFVTPQKFFYAGEAALVLALFTTTLLFVRWKKQQ